jgi:hypothetical protein
LSAAPAPDFLIVLSLERTGSTSVYRALRRTAAPGVQMLHVHFLDGDAYRPAGDEIYDSKRQREAQTRALLSDPAASGAVFTILRDRKSRIVSCLWYTRHDVLMRYYDAETDRMHPGALDAVAKRIQLLLGKEARYDRDLEQILGGTGRPAPGEHRSRSGARLFALDFRSIGRDFEAASEAVLGTPLVLPHENAGAGIGDPRGYAAFKRLCAEALAPERLALDADAS